MKSYKQLLNEWAKRTNVLHEMTSSERISVQTMLLNMYVDIRRICKDNNLILVLGGGSCLGAIRHKGLIPWDDDLDLNMPRRDYNKLIVLLKEGALGDNYEFAYPDGTMYSSSAFLKIYHKNTLFIDINGVNAPYPKGLFIDIFPIDGTPCFKPWRILKGIIANVLRFISNCVTDYQFESEIFAKALKEEPELYNCVRNRRIVGKMFSFLDCRKWMFLFDRFVSDDRITPLVTIPTGRKLYHGETIKSSLLFPPVQVPFADNIADVYKDYDAYLTQLYGNYMQVPPVEKRERHFVSTIKI